MFSQVCVGVHGKARVLPIYYATKATILDWKSQKQKFSGKGHLTAPRNRDQGSQKK